MKNKRGITMVTLVVTIVVLLILAGITVIIFDNLIVVDKAILVSNKSVESLLKEKIEIAWTDGETSYWIEKSNNLELDKKEFIISKLAENLEKQEDVQNVKVTGDMNKTKYVILEYQDKVYTFTISKNGKVELANLLKENVRVGDYVEYPIEYEDMYTKTSYTALNGWRVIDDGKMEGTSGQVRLISAGIPALWNYNYETGYDNKMAVNDLLYHFEDLELLDNSHDDLFKGSYFKYEPIADKLTTISLSDFNYAYNEMYKANRKPEDITILEHKDGLFFLEKSYYWLATCNTKTEGNIYYVSPEEIEDTSEFRIGVRPVICLKDDLVGAIESGVWKIIN